MERNPESLIMVISNPVDGLTRYLIEETAKATGKNKDSLAKRIIGVSYVDTTRLRNLTRVFMEEQHPDIKKPVIEALVLGEHGQTMVPLTSHVTINGKPLSDYASEAQMDAIVQGVVTRGNDIIVRTGTSAIAGPSIAVINMIKGMDSIASVQFPCSTWDGVRCIGQLAEFKGNAVHQVVKVAMTEQEKAKYEQSAEALDKQFAIFSAL